MTTPSRRRGSSSARPPASSGSAGCVPAASWASSRPSATWPRSTPTRRSARPGADRHGEDQDRLAELAGLLAAGAGRAGTDDLQPDQRRARHATERPAVQDSPVDAAPRAPAGGTALRPATAAAARYEPARPAHPAVGERRPAGPRQRSRRRAAAPSRAGGPSAARSGSTASGVVRPPLVRPVAGGGALGALLAPGAARGTGAGGRPRPRGCVPATWRRPRRPGRPGRPGGRAGARRRAGTRRAGQRRVVRAVPVHRRARADGGRGPRRAAGGGGGAGRAGRPA